MCTLGNFHFHLKLVVFWTYLDMIVIILSKLCLVLKMGPFGQWGRCQIEKSHFLNSFSVEFANLTNRSTPTYETW